MEVRKKEGRFKNEGKIRRIIYRRGLGKEEEGNDK